MKKYWKKYQKNIFQIIGFTIGYFLFDKIILLYIAGFLTALLLLLPQYALKFSALLDRFIGFLGNTFKTIFLFLLFWCIVCPISVIRRILHKKQTTVNASFYTTRKTADRQTDFSKLW